MNNTPTIRRTNPNKKSTIENPIDQTRVKILIKLSLETYSKSLMIPAFEASILNCSVSFPPSNILEIRSVGHFDLPNTD